MAHEMTFQFDITKDKIDSILKSVANTIFSLYGFFIILIISSIAFCEIIRFNAFFTGILILFFSVFCKKYADCKFNLISAYLLIITGILFVILSYLPLNQDTDVIYIPPSGLSSYYEFEFSK